MTSSRRCGSVAGPPMSRRRRDRLSWFADDSETFAPAYRAAHDPGSYSSRSRPATRSGAALAVRERQRHDRRQLSSRPYAEQRQGERGFVARHPRRGQRQAGRHRRGAPGLVHQRRLGTGGVIASPVRRVATPMVAGLAALCTRASTWTARAVKADIMTRRSGPLHGENHTGAPYARTGSAPAASSADKAVDNSVLAYVQDDPGAVSASFGPIAVHAATTLNKTVKVVNTGNDRRDVQHRLPGGDERSGRELPVSPSAVTVWRRCRRRRSR